MKNVLKGLLVIFILIQFIPVNIENPAVDKTIEIKASKEVMKVLKRSCYDCHSNEVKIPWYASVAPFSFSISSHIALGRKWLNFSTWENYTQEQKDKKLEGIFRTVYAAMPLPSYLWIHSEAKLTKDEIKLLRDWTGKAPY